MSVSATAREYPAPAVLAGDVGATHARLAVFTASSRVPAALETYVSHEHAGLEEMVQAFIAAHPVDLDYACFGVAAVIEGGHAETQNLAWSVDAASVARVLGLESVELINDLAANAYGIAELGPDDFAVLSAGVPVPGGTVVVISAGTGLGEAGLLPDGDGIRVISTEGGHTDFGPRSDLEVELYRYLAAGGVYVGGGIAPRILPKLREGAFMRSFAAKGRFSELLEQVPVRVILNDQAALLGAARYARMAARAR